MAPEITAGLRVRLIPAKASGWLQPLRRYAETGRIGTVAAAGRLIVRVEFDAKRKGARPVIYYVERPMFWGNYELATPSPTDQEQEAKS